MDAAPFYPRFAEPTLVEALADTPVVLIHGPRQWRKTTLAQAVGEARDYRYFSLDDEVTLASATADPVGFVGIFRSASFWMRCSGPRGSSPH